MTRRFNKSSLAARLYAVNFLLGCRDDCLSISDIFQRGVMLTAQFIFISVNLHGRGVKLPVQLISIRVSLFGRGFLIRYFINNIFK